ncbi:hypothetical protein N9L47_13755, partial [Rhodobacteraceae bacterium]|nr:hypothetical protein [Paracoccaceae bacterium]
DRICAKVWRQKDMREDEIDELLRAPQRPASSPQPPAQQRPRRSARVAGLILVLIALGLVIVPVVLARSGDPLSLLVGIALGDPFGF